ncbi:tyrosine-protein phosphatase [Streptomyces sp. ET3-23]|uniref:tyrosine-protein phosphatase n=1 Tax=Streptomyces sp. ET3-23 TaxID=2885643 RepID=UPI001D1197CE|nr:tyrosine-protein phosphatase [Streptomyces sp. ET3-23]MCC2274800.1 tyrosine-protein phosphatase [Streptomyces sp. ET3-23]
MSPFISLRSADLSRRTMLRGLGAGAAGLAAVPLLASAASAAPARPRRRSAVADTAAHQRILTVDGLHNLRDVGGYTTECGGTVAWGAVYRSGALNKVTDQGLQQLQPLKLTWLVDLRTDRERTAVGTDHIPAGAQELLAPVGDENARGGFPTVGSVSPDTIAEFRAHITDPKQRASYGMALNRIAENRGAPALVHCNSGAYRTGWLTAVLLTALGVDRDQVNADFLISNDTLGAQIAFPDYLDAAFEEVDNAYDDFHQFLTDGLGVRASAIAAMRRALIVR